MTSILIERRTGLKSASAVKGPCVVATTAPIALNGEQTIDGVSVHDGDRVLVKDQTDRREHGIYIASTGNWQRSPDFRDNADIAKGTQVYVAGGSAATRSYAVGTEDPIVIGVSEIIFIPVAGLSDPSYGRGAAGYHGATGDGTTVDTALYQQVEAENGSVYLGPGRVYNLGDTYTSKFVYGPGAVKVQGATISRVQATFDPIYTNYLFNPPVFGEVSTGDYFGRPADREPDVHNNVVISPGYPGFPTSGTQNDFYANTIVGHGNAEKLQWSRYTDSYGADSLKFAKYSERNTLLGSLACPWLGQNLTTDTSRNPSYPSVQRYYENDVLQDNGVLWTDPAWNVFGLKAHSADVVSRISAWVASDPWVDSAANSGLTALQKAQLVMANVVVGRDALNQKVIGKYNTACGYRASALNMQGDYNASLGFNAAFSNLFDSGNTAVGGLAFQHQQLGGYNTAVGYRAGNGVIKGVNNVFLGSASGAVGADYDSTVDVEMNRCVFLGPSAGAGYTGTTLNDLLVINNSGSRGPLLAGSFSGRSVAVGNLPLETAPFSKQYGATFMVYSGNSGASSYAISADDLVVQNNANAGITIATPNNAQGSIFFDDPDGAARGAIYYDHSSDTLSLRAGGVVRMNLTGTKPTVTGSRGSNAALASLLTALAGFGLITDSTT
ncbi:MAG: hypothetical protein DI589_11990 [Shinella sp.]|nr:MAG: hypothetical protein DI589_11990 [Shinella sp.]